MTGADLTAVRAMLLDALNASRSREMGEFSLYHDEGRGIGPNWSDLPTNHFEAAGDDEPACFDADKLAATVSDYFARQTIPAKVWIVRSELHDFDEAFTSEEEAEAMVAKFQDDPLAECYRYDFDGPDTPEPSAPATVASPSVITIPEDWTAVAEIFGGFHTDAICNKCVDRLAPNRSGDDR